MAQTASDHIQACHAGQSEAHNRRTEEYMRRLKPDNVYIRLDLTPRNEEWVSEQIGSKSLVEYLDQVLKPLVKAKTGRKMQEKQRTMVDKKTGRAKTVNGSSALRESVVLIKDDTSMADIQRYAQAVHEKFGITPLQIFIHRDEGHHEGQNKEWKPNLHAHIVWDWINHNDGKSWKLNLTDTSELQTMAATYLEMERGKSKAETGAEHLKRNDYILAKQEKEIKLGEARLESLEMSTQMARDKKEEIMDDIADLREQRIAKRRELNQENGNTILNKAASLIGKGDLGKARKRVRQLEQELASIAKAHQEEIQAIRQHESETIAQARQHQENVIAQAQQHEAEAVKQAKQLVTKEKDKTISDLKKTISSRDSTISQWEAYHQHKVDKLNATVEEQKCEIANLSNRNSCLRKSIASIGEALARLLAWFNEAVEALVSYMKDNIGYNGRSFLSGSEALAIKSAILNLCENRKQPHNVNEIATIVAITAANRADVDQYIENRGLQHAIDAANGGYDRIIHRQCGQGLSR